MFTLEESALLRRMLRAVMWIVLAFGVVGVYFLSRPWWPQLAVAGRWLLR